MHLSDLFLAINNHVMPKSLVWQLKRLIEFVIDSEGLMQNMTASVKVVSVENFLRGLLFCGLCEGQRSPGVLIAVSHGIANSGTL